MIDIFVSIIPVFIFLIILLYFDSYKLVKISMIIIVIIVGSIAALLSYVINSGLLNLIHINSISYAQYIAPIIEESLKALFIIYLISQKKIGFMIDAVIYGFAIGAGFAFVENIYYLNELESANIFLWIIRGFGTAIMHGGTTAIFSILTKNFFDTSHNLKIFNYLPGLISAILYHSLFLIFMPGLFTAIVIHSFFNHLFVPAFAITMLQLILLPVLIYIVFQRSEKKLSDWMETGMDNDVKLLGQINSGNFTDSHAGQYLESLSSKFSKTVLADMLCLIKIQLELSLKAKGILLLRKEGLPVVIDSEIKEKLNELKFLEKSIGTTGKLAISPIFKTSSKDLWQLYYLTK